MMLFQEKEIRQWIEINHETIQAIEEGFTKLAAGKATMPPIMRVDIPENQGEVDIKSAYIQGYNQFAIKLSSGFFNNYKLGLPSGNGMMILVSSETGVPQSILLDNGYLTDIRTAAAGAVASNHLAKKHVENVGVIGSGSQARYQMIALKNVRDFKRLTVYSKTPANAEEFAKEMEVVLKCEVRVAAHPSEVVKESEIVVTTTPSTEPVIQADWVHPGLHITAMGSDAEHKQELDAKLLNQADVLVCDSKSQCFRLGELHHALDQGFLTKDSPIVELGEITSGKTLGRTDNHQITVCDLTGTGVQDTMIAMFASNRLQEKKLGLHID